VWDTNVSSRSGHDDPNDPNDPNDSAASAVRNTAARRCRSRRFDRLRSEAFPALYAQGADNRDQILKGVKAEPELR